MPMVLTPIVIEEVREESKKRRGQKLYSQEKLIVTKDMSLVDLLRKSSGELQSMLNQAWDLCPRAWDDVFRLMQAIERVAPMEVYKHKRLDRARIRQAKRAWLAGACYRHNYRNVIEEELVKWKGFAVTKLGVSYNPSRLTRDQANELAKAKTGAELCR